MLQPAPQTRPMRRQIQRLARNITHPHIALAQLGFKAGHIIGKQIEGAAVAQIKPRMMPMASENAIAHAAAIQRKSHVRTSIIHRCNSFTIHKNRNGTLRAFDHHHFAFPQFLQRANLNPFLHNTVSVARFAQHKSTFVRAGGQSALALQLVISITFPIPQTNKMHKKLVILTGAGISAESGIKTFRASDGLWEEHRIEDVATREAFYRDPALVLDFYNQRRKQVMAAQPNEAHLAIARLQDNFDVQIITQNIDDLHERAGSKNVIHLHGEIMKARNSMDPNDFYPIENGEIHVGDTSNSGAQLRPDVVWFGEEVPLIRTAQQVAQEADIFVVIGTSLSVYPAAGLLDVAEPHIVKFLVDPGTFVLRQYENLYHIQKPAVEGMKVLLPMLEKNVT